MPGWGIRADVNAFNAQRETPYYLTLLAGAYLVQEPGLDITVMHGSRGRRPQKQARGERALRVLRRGHHRADAS